MGKKLEFENETGIAATETSADETRKATPPPPGGLWAWMRGLTPLAWAAVLFGVALTLSALFLPGKGLVLFCFSSLVACLLLLGTKQTEWWEQKKTWVRDSVSEACMAWGRPKPVAPAGEPHTEGASAPQTAGSEARPATVMTRRAVLCLVWAVLCLAAVPSSSQLSSPAAALGFFSLRLLRDPVLVTHALGGDGCPRAWWAISAAVLDLPLALASSLFLASLCDIAAETLKRRDGTIPKWKEPATHFFRAVAWYSLFAGIFADILAVAAVCAVSFPAKAGWFHDHNTVLRSVLPFVMTWFAAAQWGSAALCGGFILTGLARFPRAKGFFAVARTLRFSLVIAVLVPLLFLAVPIFNEQLQDNLRALAEDMSLVAETAPREAGVEIVKALGLAEALGLTSPPENSLGFGSYVPALSHILWSIFGLCFFCFTVSYWAWMLTHLSHSEMVTEGTEKATQKQSEGSDYRAAFISGAAFASRWLPRLCAVTPGILIAVSCFLAAERVPAGPVPGYLHGIAVGSASIIIIIYVYRFWKKGGKPSTHSNKQTTGGQVKDPGPGFWARVKAGAADVETVWKNSQVTGPEAGDPWGTLRKLKRRHRQLLLYTFLPGATLILLLGFGGSVDIGWVGCEVGLLGVLYIFAAGWWGWKLKLLRDRFRQILPDTRAWYAPASVVLVALATAGIIYISWLSRVDAWTSVRGCGTIAVMLIGFAFLVPVGSLLSYLGQSTGFPYLSLAIALPFVFGALDLNDDHAVRLLSAAPPGPTTSPRRARAEATQTAAANRLTLLPAFEAWLRERDHHDGKPIPVIFVAAEGGGIRAAYEAGLTLAHLQDDDKRFRHHLFLVSSVSGGSVGAMTFTQLLRTFDDPRDLDPKRKWTGARDRQQPTTLIWNQLTQSRKSSAGANHNHQDGPDAKGVESANGDQGAVRSSNPAAPTPVPDANGVWNGGWEARFDAVIRYDVLSPTVAGMLGPDLFQRWLPFAVSDENGDPRFDRSQGLELGLEKAWSDGMALLQADTKYPDYALLRRSDEGGVTSQDTLKTRLMAPLAELYPTNPQDFAKANLPILYMNSTCDTGDKFVFTEVEPTEMTGLASLSSIEPHPNLRCSTAACLSARFPLFTSCGYLPAHRDFPGANPMIKSETRIKQSTSTPSARFRLKADPTDKSGKAMTLPPRFEGGAPATEPDSRENLGKTIKLRFVDGGYFENSGIDTLTTVILSLQDYTKDRMREKPKGDELPRWYPVVITIALKPNRIHGEDPETRLLTPDIGPGFAPGTLMHSDSAYPKVPKQSNGFDDILTPVETLAQTGSGQANRSESRLARVMWRFEPFAAEKPDALYGAVWFRWEYHTADERGETLLPLGWTLSLTARREMVRQLTEDADGDERVKQVICNYLRAIYDGKAIRPREVGAGRRDYSVFCPQVILRGRSEDELPPQGTPGTKGTTKATPRPGNSASR